MKKTFFVLASSLVGIGVCFGSAWLFPRLGVSANFPAPGGEDEFSLRFVYFIVGVCPAYLLLGAWIGHAGFGLPRRWLAMWAGAEAGAALSFIAAHLLQHPVAQWVDGQSGIPAVLAFYLLWVALSALGAVSLRRTR